MTRDLARIESGTLSLSLEAVPLAAVMLECQALIEPQAKLRGVRVIFVPLETHCIASADRVRLQQVLDYLLSAAIEYGEADGTVVVNCETQGSERIRIGIAGGEGFSSDRLTRLFQLFDDGEPEATPAEGTQISVLLAARLVRLMGGTIGAQSSVGTRSRFSFDLIRISIPMAAGLARTAMPGGGRAQVTVHSPDARNT